MNSSLTPRTGREMVKHDMEAAVKAFFSTPKFAVAGASQNSSKFGYKGTHGEDSFQYSITVRVNVDNIAAVLAWYHLHGLPVTPINPTSPEIELPSQTYKTVSSLSALNVPEQTALSVITPPAVTKKILEEAKRIGIPAVWLQPGSFDDEGLEYAEANFKAAVGGQAGVGGEGWCVLVDGESALQAIDRGWHRQNL